MKTLSILEAEKRYWNTINKQHTELVKLYNNIKFNNLFSLDEKQITKAILLRMKYYYRTQQKIKTFLNKRYLSAASDFFVETILFYLKLYLDIKNYDLEVHSERQIIKKRGSIRPDISIWKKNEVISIIECKTQLGWNRNTWEEDFRKRELKLKTVFSKARAFLVVMTSENWPGFENADKIGKYYFTLSSVRPIDIDDDNNIDEFILNPIEVLFQQLF